MIKNYYQEALVCFFLRHSNLILGQLLSPCQVNVLLQLWTFWLMCFVRSCFPISYRCSKACFSIPTGSSRSLASWCWGPSLKVETKENFHFLWKLSWMSLLKFVEAVKLWHPEQRLKWAEPEWKVAKHKLKAAKQKLKAGNWVLRRKQVIQ